MHFGALFSHRGILSYLSAIRVHLQCQGQKTASSEMPGTRTVTGTDNRSGGKSPVSPVIRALVSPQPPRV